MAYGYLSPIPASDGLDGKAWEKWEELGAAGNGKWYLMPKGVLGGSVTLEVVSGEGKIQFTTSPVAKVKDGSAVAVDWPEGSVTSTTANSFNPVTAVRQVNASGTTRLHLRVV